MPTNDPPSASMPPPSAAAATPTQRTPQRTTGLLSTVAAAASSTVAAAASSVMERISPSKNQAAETATATPRASNASNNESDLLTAGVDFFQEEGLTAVGKLGVGEGLPVGGNNGGDDDVSSIAMSISRVPAEQRESSDVATTARKTSKAKGTGAAKKPKSEPIGKGKRVKAQKIKLLNIVDVDSPAYEVLASYDRNDTNFYGTVMSAKDARNFYSIKFDLFPMNHQTFKVTRKTLTVLKKGEDEPAFDREQARAADEAEECATTKKKDCKYAKESTDLFLNLSPEEQKTAKTFNFKYGSNEEDNVAWTILQDDEDITTDTMTDEVKTLSPFKIDIPWNKKASLTDYSNILFEHFLPSVKGKAKILDRYLRHDNSGWKTTVHSENIKFHRPNADDPDELVSIT